MPFINRLCSRSQLMFVCILTIAFLSACSKEIPTLSASSSETLTSELVLDAQFSRDNKLAYLLTKGPNFTIWDLSSATSKQFISAENLTPNTRKFTISDTGSRLLTSDGKTLSLWQLSDLQLLGSLDFSSHLGDANITSMAFIRDSILVTGNSDGSLIFADLDNQVFRRSQFHSNEVVQIIVGHDKQFLYSAGNDGRVITSDLQLYEIKSEYETPFRITSLVSNEDNSIMFVSDALDKQTLLRPFKNAVAAELDYWQQYRFFRLGLFMDEDRKLLTTSPKTELSLWDSKTGKEIASWQATTQSGGSTVMDVGLLFDKQIITITSDAVVETWDLAAIY